jgi:hypothetical protein
MYFTQDQIDEIVQRVAIRGVKDTQLNTADALTGEELIAIVQQGDNKQLSVDKFFDGWVSYIDRTGRVSIFNASVYAGSLTSPYAFSSLIDAVTNLPVNIRRCGQIITYLSTDTNWYAYQYVGTSIDITSWTNPNNWKAANVLQTLGDNAALPISQYGVTRSIETLTNAILAVYPEIAINNIELLVNNHNTDFITEYRNFSPLTPDSIVVNFPQGTSRIVITTPTGEETVVSPTGTSYTTDFRGTITQETLFTTSITYQGVTYIKTVKALPVHPTVINGVNKGIKVSSIGAYNTTFSGQLVVKTNGPITKVKVNGLPIRTTTTTNSGEYTYTSEDSFVSDTYLIELV